jgi:hypothetical protein
VTSSAPGAGEFGDDPGRYADARPKELLGMSPITKASSAKRVVLAGSPATRLGDALFLQAFAALNNSQGRALYDRQRARATHYQALRTLANRLVSILHGCLRSHTYDEHLAWHSDDKLSPVTRRFRSWDV